MVLYQMEGLWKWKQRFNSCLFSPNIYMYIYTCALKAQWSKAVSFRPSIHVQYASEKSSAEVVKLN